MAWSRIRTYGLLDRWRVRFNQQPYQFQQVSDGYDLAAPTVWIQREREELARSLMAEVEDFNNWVGYNPRPMFHEEIVRLNPNNNFWNQNLAVSKSLKVIGFGQEAKTLLGTATISYSGNTATFSLTTDEIESGELYVLFQAADVDGNGGDLRYSIGSLTSYYDGSAYQWEGHRSLFVKPTLQNELDSFLNGDPAERNVLNTDASNFVTTVDIYRVYRDTTVTAKLLSRDGVTNTVLENDINVILTNPEYGQFNVNVDATFSGIPFAIKVWYEAGKELNESGTMFTPFETMIVRRAKAEFPVSVDQVAYRASANWQNDSTLITDIPNGAAFANPIGNRMIDWYTWQLYRQYGSHVVGQAAIFANG
jgi:hypothetical protein